MNQSRRKKKSTISIPYKMRKEYLLYPDSNHLKLNFYGEIYEHYAYFKLLEIVNPHIDILDKSLLNTKFGNFSINGYGSIHYHSDDINVAEFDVLGMDENTIYHFEITMSQASNSEKNKRISIREELLRKIFPNMNIKTIIVCPSYITHFTNFEKIHIDTPDFNNHGKSNCYKSKRSSRKLMTLKKFSSRAGVFNYIEELKILSDLFFEDNINFENSILFERVYDLSTIDNDEIIAYNFKKQSFIKILVKNNSLYKDGQKILKHKKTYHEIREMRKKNNGSN